MKTDFLYYLQFGLQVLICFLHLFNFFSWLSLFSLNDLLSFSDWLIFLFLYFLKGKFHFLLTGLYNLHIVIFKVFFFCFNCVGMLSSHWCRTARFWWSHIDLYAVECVLTLSSANLFLQWVQVGAVHQGVPLLVIAAVEAHDLGGGLSSRCRWVWCSSRCSLSQGPGGCGCCWVWFGVWEGCFQVSVVLLVEDKAPYFLLEATA